MTVATSWREVPVVFPCEGERLIGIAALPEQSGDTGVLIIVGGPQYRSGSHRQFTLLARELAENGIASFRFDYRGMGDSEGSMRNFEVIGPDINAALETFLAHAPGVRNIVLWGLCDAASAALYYGADDTRVSGLILLNPWVHSRTGAAKARIRHYYLSRILQRSFWSKLLRGKVKVGGSLAELGKSTALAAGAKASASEQAPADPRHGSPGYIDRMLRGLERFKGTVTIILSGDDLTAQEFMNLASSDARWRKALRASKARTTVVEQANHTFSSKVWRARVADLTMGGIKP